VSQLSIAVVITNYNTWEKTMKSVEGHWHYAGDALTTITIVDDCSDHVWTNGLPDKVELIRNDSNLGLVKSANIGFARSDADIIVLFDSDAYPTMNYSNIVLSEFQSDPRLAVLGFKTSSPEGKSSDSSEDEPGALSLLLGQRMYGLYKTLFKRVHEPLVVYSCAMAVRRSAFQEVGGFDEGFDWLDLDHDLCMNLRRHGWKIKQSKDLHAIHEGGGTPQLTCDRVLRFYRNRWYLLRKYQKIKNVFIWKHLILLRLLGEYLFLLLFGKLGFSNTSVLHEKMEGRKNIIRYCMKDYR
jgi:GT2 family glycosyltransferase